MLANGRWDLIWRVKGYDSDRFCEP